MSIIKSKRRRPESLGYNSWMPLAFPVITLAASTAPTTVEARIPLALNVKIVAVSYVLSGSLAGGTSFNIALGAGSYETAGSSAFGGSTLGGTFAAGDQVIFVIGGVSYTFNVTARTAGSLVKLASGIARSINKNAALNGTYIASQSGNNGPNGR